MSNIQKALLDIATDKNISLFGRARAAVILAELTKGQIIVNPKKCKVEK